MSTNPAYLLGDDTGELQRLEEQARMLAPATRAILEMAGIRPGMRVVDLGTGAGDVALELAAMVGPSGSVIGIDQSAEALACARRRTAARGFGNVSFVQDELHTAGSAARSTPWSGAWSSYTRPTPRRFSDGMQPSSARAGWWSRWSTR